MTETLDTTRPDRPPANPWRRAALSLAVSSLALAVGLVIALVDQGSSLQTRTAAASKQLACAELAALPGNSFVLAKHQAEIYRIGLIGDAALLAAEQDHAYQSFDNALKGPEVAVNITFSTRSPQFVTAMKAAQVACKR